MPFPSGYIPPSVSNGGFNKGSALVVPSTQAMQAVAGVLGTQVARFMEERVYNDQVSEKLQKEGVFREVHDSYEVVEIKNDPYSTVKLRTSCISDPTREVYNELSHEQQAVLADLQYRFRTRQNTGDTPLEAWDAINPADIGYLNKINIQFVEQIAAFKEEEVYRLGKNGKSLRDRALRHVNSKTPNKAEEWEKDMYALMEAKEGESKAREALEAKLLELQAQMAELQKGKPGRRPGVQEEVA